ncbi:MAG: hypothetical protein QF492_05320 [Candidatus Krumholzibacteria bacterium]|jgi:hypothetical protein|nr:hypothetical protein [Candidatus Krumholzibacteria bacterium]MDP6669309.1 hypothetical protein [Candidatus Krumholzibacteria bacterium]MDP6796900.1 hypothetical protein [Candidatus Krumholzibacteria bacterium]MDP7021009.1 hypothetical protein [Candidatus Krumholzibacteria bacterium]
MFYRGTGILLLLAVAAASALEIDQVYYDRAFSPNADGVQDSCALSFHVDGGEEDLALVRAEIHTDPTQPPDSGTLARLLLEESALGTNDSRYSLKWGGEGEDGETLPDGFYYLHLYALTGTEELWMDTPVELEINTIAPDLVSTALEPSPFFTPLLEGADSLQQVFFTSSSFDTLTDTALLRIYQLEEGSVSQELRLLERDSGYRVESEFGWKYRFLWNGMDEFESRADGLYLGWIVLEDDAGNSDSTSVNLDMDILAPSVSVFGYESASSFHWNPADVPDTLFLRVSDRHDVDSCRVAWGLDAEFDTEAISLGTGSGDSEDFSLLLPEAWTADSTYVDSTYRIQVDARDLAGHWMTEISSSQALSFTLDSLDPEAPEWTTPGGRRIQSSLSLDGTVSEADLTVLLFQGASETARDTLELSSSYDFSFFVQLEDGPQTFQVQAFDPAGNLSALSGELELVYEPGAEVLMPGRFRGGSDETIRINTPGDALSVELRFFSLEGKLVRSLEASGGPQEWLANWDLLGDGGRPLMGGLYLVNVLSTMNDGSLRSERKVVALVP